MFPELKEYLDELEVTAESTSDFLRTLNGARTRLRNAILESEEQVKLMKNETKYVAELKKTIGKNVIKAAKDIMFGKIIAALQTNYEFDAPPYRNALFRASQNNDTYKVRSSGTGFKSIISVDINLDATGGRLNQWASGIKAYRKVLEAEKKQKRDAAAKKKGKKSKVVKYDPLAASRAWAGIFERREGTHSQFSETVRARLSLSGAIAPFWQLVDKGTLPMSSDRGGFPTPAGSKINFVQQSEEAAKIYASNQLNNAKIKYQKLFADYEAFIEVEQARLIRLDGLAEEIRLDLRVANKLQRKLGLETKDINRSKFQKAVQLIRQGLINAGRVDVSAPGTGKRVRPSVETIKELL